ncbi:transmembrane protein, putative [Medicago truncatula]|uniref:Transmembrane protein, putative n=1 Tax=Medicago truncatula TaxID=3880 RepID=G7KGU1_MEDTR|nr:transmembrane protein, putative [Medicago truncatula]
MGPLERSNLVGCQATPAVRTMILTYGVYTISVDLGLSLRWLIALDDRTVILMCVILLI